MKLTPYETGEKALPDPVDRMDWSRITKDAVDLAGTQTHLARIIDTSQQAVSNWERGKCRPSSKYRERILAVLNGDISLEVED